MTPEELLKPRYKVIALWPQNNIIPFHLGDILVKNGIHFTRLEIPKSLHENEIGNYQHLFEKLEWWKERKNEEMPEYVKSQRTGRIYKMDGYDFKDSYCWIVDENAGRCIIGLNYFLSTKIPATEEEYYKTIK